MQTTIDKKTSAQHLSTNLICHCNKQQSVFETLSCIRGKIQPAKESRLRRNTSWHVIGSYIGMKKGAADTLDAYYVNMINDSLWLMRHRKVAYLYSLEQVAEILRFEPDACITCDDGIYYATL